MKFLISTAALLLGTVSRVIASGGDEPESLSFLTILFMGFGALILVCQIFPAVALFAGIIKGILAPAAKKEATREASGDTKS